MSLLFLGIFTTAPPSKVSASTGNLQKIYKCCICLWTIQSEIYILCSCGLPHLVLWPRCSHGQVWHTGCFLLLLLHPGDFCLMGFKFNKLWCVDKAMPMGCSVPHLRCSAPSSNKWSRTALTVCLSSASCMTSCLWALCGTSLCGHLPAFLVLAGKLENPVAQDKTEGSPMPVIQILRPAFSEYLHIVLFWGTFCSN